MGRLHSLQGRFDELGLEFEIAALQRATLKSKLAVLERRGRISKA